MIGSIQMEKPKQDSPDYYLSFYNMYNLLQINDAIIFGVFDEAVERNQMTTEELLRAYPQIASDGQEGSFSKQ